MTQNNTEIFSQLEQITGAGNVIRAEADMARYLDEPRNKFHGAAAAVVRPADTGQVSQILALANETKTPVVPQGGNTGLVGGQVPDASRQQIVLSLERLNRIRNVDANANAMTVEAGTTLAAAQEAARDNDRFFPLSLASQGSCTIGGNLATNAGGLNVVAYGPARDLCLGLEVVLPDGRAWNGLNALRKNNTGYDLKNLFIGAEGTLGVITAATLKLFPQPVAKSTAFIGISSPQQALDLLNLAQRESGQRVTTIELLPRLGIEITLEHKNTRDPFETAHNWYVLLELSSTRADDDISTLLEGILAKALEKEMIEDAVVAHSLAQREDLWALRELLPEAQKFEGGSIKHDVSVPLNKIPAFLDEAEQAVKKRIPGARPVPFGHVGDGNIHFNITEPKDADTQAFLARWDEVSDIVHDIVLQMNGSVSAEHGIGQLKRPLMAKIKSDVELDTMKAVKNLFDPNNIMNPGKVLP